MPVRFFFIIIPGLFFLIINKSLAQVPGEPEFDTQAPPDTTVREETPVSAEPIAPVPEHELQDPNRIPRQRAIMSAVLPGLGQAFNRKYWKIPIIYGAGATLGYLIRYNHIEYRQHQNLLEQAQANPAVLANPQINTYNYNTVDAVRVQRDFYRRDRDLFIIVSGLTYALNIIDAYVDAHLRSFDLSDDLTMAIKPALFNNNSYFCPGLSINLNFSK